MEAAERRGFEVLVNKKGEVENIYIDGILVAEIMPRYATMVLNVGVRPHCLITLDVTVDKDAPNRVDAEKQMYDLLSGLGETSVIAVEEIISKLPATVAMSQTQRWDMLRRLRKPKNEPKFNLIATPLTAFDGTPITAIIEPGLDGAYWYTSLNTAS